MFYVTRSHSRVQPFAVAAVLFVTTFVARAGIPSLWFPPPLFWGHDATSLMALRFSVLGYVTIRVVQRVSLAAPVRVALAILAATALAGLAWGTAQALAESHLFYGRVTVIGKGTEVAFTGTLLSGELSRMPLLAGYAAVVALTQAAAM